MRCRDLLVLAALALLAALTLAAPAQAAFGIKEAGFEFLDEAGEPVSQAGAHPFSVRTTFELNTVPVAGPREEVPDGGQLKDLVAKLPVGLVGDPTAVPYCPDEDFNTVSEWHSACPNSTVVGTGSFRASIDGPPGLFDVPVYNLAPPPGVALELGVAITTIPVTIEVRINPSPPYNAIATSTNASEVGIVYGSTLELWGNPADPAHDPYRGSCLELERTSPNELGSSGKCPFEGEGEAALITLPRACTGPLTALFEADSWDNPGAFASAEAQAPGMEGCDQLGLDASIKAQPTTHEASSPAGLDFDLEVDNPGLTDPSQNAGSDIKATTVTLPEGITVDPSQAEGLGACSLAGYESLTISSQPGEGCPLDSKLGTVEAQTSLLEGVNVTGGIFLAKPFENPSDSLIALYMVLREPERGIFVKLAGKVSLDPETGQITTSFEDLPQLPISHFHLHFNGGPRAPLITPDRCGEYTAQAVLTPWANPGQPVTTSASFQVGSGPGGGLCPPSSALPFAPSFGAGTGAPVAGQFSPFFMRVQRQDGEQELTRFSALLPPGVLAKVAGMSPCPQEALEAAKQRSGGAEKAAPSCPASSQIGTLTAGAGAGSELTYVPGSLYLAGPFEGASLSVAAVVPAVAGPFDLGTVVVQQGLALNPVSGEAEVLASGEPLPRILEGIPLHLRDLRIAVDRPQFTLNASGCGPEAVRATLWGAGTDPLNTADDMPFQASAPYQATDCAALGFKPSLKLSFKGGMGRSGNPAVSSTVTPRAGDSNIGRAVVLLPPSELIDNAHINNPCTRVQFAANACPPSSILGTARAFSPLLDTPLEGPVYFRSNGGERELPDIVADLHGLFHITVVGFIDSKKGRIRTTFASVPDAPVSKFQIKLYGGKRGLLENNHDLCAGIGKARVSLEAHNGRRYQFEPKIGRSCKGKKHKPGRHHPRKFPRGTRSTRAKLSK